MLKGVNRQIIEIAETGSPDFERALLFVRAPYTGHPEELLRMKGRQMVDRAGSYSGMRRSYRRCWLRRVLWTLASGAAGGLCGALLFR